MVAPPLNFLLKIFGSHAHRAFSQDDLFGFSVFRGLGTGSNIRIFFLQEFADKIIDIKENVLVAVSRNKTATRAKQRKCDAGIFAVLVELRHGEFVVLGAHAAGLPSSDGFFVVFFMVFFMVMIKIEFAS
jgi:hypothetical protein